MALIARRHKEEIQYCITQLTIQTSLRAFTRKINQFFRETARRLDSNKNADLISVLAFLITGPYFLRGG